MKVCSICKQKRIGCTKFCNKYKTDYDMCIETIKIKMRNEQREYDIVRRIRERS